MTLRHGLSILAIVTSASTILQMTSGTTDALPSTQPSVQEENDRFVRQWLDRLAGRESEPARVAFKNIQLDWFKDTPARQLLEIMDGGYAKALGVRCTHCHVETDFASDEKRPKNAAREMARMHWDVNRRLAAMTHLKHDPQERFINCATCHRGRTDPHDPEP